MSTPEKRRSDRLLLTLPLRVEGADARGEAFKVTARTVNVSRHGAQVHIPRHLATGQNVRLHNPLVRHEADFRVVAPISSSTERGGHYGVECLDAQRNIWQIHFPSTENGAPSDARALLDCRICGTVRLAGLTFGELEALRTIGMVAKSCEVCKAETPTRYAQLGTGKPGQENWMASLARLTKPRRHRRVFLQLPIGLRDARYRMEVARTENVSRGGFCFTSERDYPAAEHVMVVFPGDSVSRQVEIPAQVVWQQALARSKRSVYGMRCERPAN